MNFVVISPLKDEENTVDSLLSSINNQTIKPDLLVLINDGSSDSTGKILDEFCIKHDYAFVIHNESKFRSSGGHVVDLIYLGLQKVDEIIPDWDILLKVDGDIEFEESDYFEFMINKFKQFPNLGIASGELYHLDKYNNKVYESKYRWKTWGASKFYQRKCLEDIGGLKRFKGWDGLDDVFARDKGYITQKFNNKAILHHYETQTRIEEGGVYEGVKREVLGYRYRSYPFVFFIGKTIKYLKKRPYVLRSLFYFTYSIYANLFIESKLNKQEKLIVRKHLKKQLSDDFDYIEN